MRNFVALIDSNLKELLAYYRMFSCDKTWVGHIEISPTNIYPIVLSSFEELLTHLRNHLLRGVRAFLVGMHGTEDALPYPIIRGAIVSTDYNFINLLQSAANGDANAKAQMLGWIDEKSADRLINLISQIRMTRIDHLEIRGCNIGAGPVLGAIHDCLNSRHTVAPNVRFIAGIVPTVGINNISPQRLQKQIHELSIPRRTFNCTECLLPFSTQVGLGSSDTALGIQIIEAGDKFNFRLCALSHKAIQGWTRVFLEDFYYFIFSSYPPGGGYRFAGNLPIIAMWLPKKTKPFAFPGDGFDYLKALAVKNTP